VKSASLSCRQWGPGTVLALTEAGCQGSFDLVLLVTLPVGRGTVFIKLEKPNGRL
jgi:hypothetical protein